MAYDKNNILKYFGSIILTGIMIFKSNKIGLRVKKKKYWKIFWDYAYLMAIKLVYNKKKIIKNILG